MLPKIEVNTGGSSSLITLAALGVGGFMLYKILSDKNKEDQPITNAKISGYTSPLKVGDTCRIRISFDYQGEAFTTRLYAALGNDRGPAAFDTMNDRTITIEIPKQTTRQTLEYFIDVPVISSTSSGGTPYDIYAKIGDVDMDRVFGAVVIASQTPMVTEARIIDYTTNLNVGDNCRVTVQFVYSGPSTTVDLFAALGNDKGPLAFDTMSKITKAVQLPETDAPTIFERSIDIPVKSSSTNGGSPYDIYAKIGNTDMDRLFDVVKVVSLVNGGEGGGYGVGGNPAISISGSLTIAYGALLQFSFSGYAPNALIDVIVDNNQYPLIDQALWSNLYGAGSGQFSVWFDVGSHVLTIKDYVEGNTKSITFYVAAASGGGGGSGSAQVSAVQVDIKNAGNATHYGIQYYDPVYGEFVDGGTHKVSEHAYFNYIYPGGYVAVNIWNGSSWSAWKYSQDFAATSGSKWVIDYSSGLIDWTYKP